MSSPAWLRLKLSLADAAPERVEFVVEFWNDSHEIKSTFFSGNEGEVAKHGLRIRAGGAVLEPVEYRSITRRSPDLPEVTIPAGDCYRFKLTGWWDDRMLRFGKTSFWLDSGTYSVSLQYGGAESNSITWDVK